VLEEKKKKGEGWRGEGREKEGREENFFE